MLMLLVVRELQYLSFLSFYICLLPDAADAVGGGTTGGSIGGAAAAAAENHQDSL